MVAKGPVRAQQSPEGPERSGGGAPSRLDGEHATGTRGRGRLTAAGLRAPISYLALRATFYRRLAAVSARPCTDRKPGPPIKQMDALEVDGERRPVAFPQRGKTVDRRAHAPAFAALDEFGLIIVDAQTVTVGPRGRRLDLEMDEQRGA